MAPPVLLYVLFFCLILNTLQRGVRELAGPPSSLITFYTLLFTSLSPKDNYSCALNALTCSFYFYFFPKKK